MSIRLAKMKLNCKSKLDFIRLLCKRYSSCYVILTTSKVESLHSAPIIYYLGYVRL